jgi:hypothetical protein
MPYNKAEATKFIEVTGVAPPTVPLWLVGLGIVAGACVLTLAVTKALKWW